MSFWGAGDSQETCVHVAHVACLTVFTAKNFFRVSHRTAGQLQSHCFQASDAFNKQQWINCIRQAKEAAALTGEPLTGLGGQMASALTSCCHWRPECDRAVWGETDSGQRLEAVASPSGEGDTRQGEEVLADGGTSLGTDRETRRDKEVSPVVNSEAEDGALDEELGGEGDAHTEAAGDICASSCQQQEEREKMEKKQEEEMEEQGQRMEEQGQEMEEQRQEMEREQRAAVEEEEAGLDTREVSSPQSEEHAHRC